MKKLASASITSQQIDEEKMETVADFILLGSRITMESVCSHKIKRVFLLGRKAMRNIDSVLKSQNITLAMEAHIVKARLL